MKHFEKHTRHKLHGRQVSLVALLGPKPPDLDQLIKLCINTIRESEIGYMFSPLSIQDIHATIIGLEHLQDPTGIYNLNIWLDRAQKEEMKCVEMLDLLRSSFPMNVRFGGLSQSFDTFMSWGSNPYVRSFQFLFPAGDFTLVGWPHENDNYGTQILWKLRQKMENQCNIRHKYAAEQDNDFFMRIGTLKTEEDCREMVKDNELLEKVTIAEKQIHEYLYRNPVDVKIALSDVYVVEYDITSPRIHITNSTNMADDRVDGDFLRRLIAGCG
jgi:hypothetical protein